MSHAHFTHEFPRVLSIAGSDSGGGAGIQADLKTFAALGCFGMTAITALTAQNTQGVRAIHGVPPAMLLDQIDAVVEDIGVHATKIGMLHSVEVVQAVTQAIARHQLKRIVLDPVMVATSGAVLISPDAVAELVRQLFAQADLITPNLDEAALLVGRPLQNENDIETAAKELLDKGAQAVLLKGGHMAGETVSDLFLSRSGESFWTVVGHRGALSAGPCLARGRSGGPRLRQSGPDRRGAGAHRPWQWPPEPRRRTAPYATYFSLIESPCLSKTRTPLHITTLSRRSTPTTGFSQASRMPRSGSAWAWACWSCRWALIWCPP
ncbi:MAG: hypothetical protein RLZZ239_2024 [Pseudomonadota bacterium]